MLNAKIKPTAQRATHRALPKSVKSPAALGRSGGGQSFGFVLPAWCNSLEGRLILSNIQADPPRFVANHGTDEAAAHGLGEYRGKWVRKLRDLFWPAERAMMDHCDAAKGQPEVEREHRAAHRAWVASHGPDAIISKVLGR